MYEHLDIKLSCFQINYISAINYLKRMKNDILVHKAYTYTISEGTRCLNISTEIFRHRECSSGTSFEHAELEPKENIKRCHLK